MRKKNFMAVLLSIGVLMHLVLPLAYADENIKEFAMETEKSDVENTDLLNHCNEYGFMDVDAVDGIVSMTMSEYESKVNEFINTPKWSYCAWQEMDCESERYVSLRQMIDRRID